MPVTYRMASGRTGAALSRTPPASAPCFVANVPIVASRVDVAFLRIKCDGKKKVSRSVFKATQEQCSCNYRWNTIRLFLFYCLLLNHSFQTNAHSRTKHTVVLTALNFSLYYNLQLHCSCVAFFLYRSRPKRLL